MAILLNEGKLIVTEQSVSYKGTEIPYAEIGRLELELCPHGKFLVLLLGTLGLVGLLYGLGKDELAEPILRLIKYLPSCWIVAVLLVYPRIRIYSKTTGKILATWTCVRKAREAKKIIDRYLT